MHVLNKCSRLPLSEFSFFLCLSFFVFKNDKGGSGGGSGGGVSIMKYIMFAPWL